MATQTHVIEEVPVDSLTPYTGNARRHSKKPIQQIARSIERFGFTNPILVDDELRILAGHGRVAAAKLLGIKTVPIIRISHLSAAERRAYILADNKLALNAGWDRELLAIELQGLLEVDFDLEVTGFSLAEIDVALDEAAESATADDSGTEDDLPDLVDDAVTRPGDLWALGRHKLICEDAGSPEPYSLLLADETVDLIFTDPRYDMSIDGEVGGSARARCPEFAMGAGEMASAAFTQFLTETLGHAELRCRNGAIAFVCMDWRHMRELLAAGDSVFSELKDLCIWTKANSSMGAFYRGKHQLIFVFKVGDAPHINTFGRGQAGRYRTNVWEYPGIRTMGSARLDELDLATRSTVKSVALVADAIKDCSKRGQIVLDPFGGSGTTLIAAEKSGRIARLIESDPTYCDAILRRFERVTGKQARLSATGDSFEDVEASRSRAVLR